MSLSEEGLHALVEEMTAAFHKHDLDGVMSNYEEGATVVFQPGQNAREPAAIRAGFEQFFALDPTFTYPHGYTSIVTEDVALHLSPWNMEGTSPEGPIEMSGLSVSVWRRQPDGGWKMVVDNPFGSVLLPQN